MNPSAHMLNDVEAVDIYAHGSPEYRANTGRTTVLRTIPLLVTIADRKKLLSLNICQIVTL